MRYETPSCPVYLETLPKRSFRKLSTSTPSQFSGSGDWSPLRGRGGQGRDLHNPGGTNLRSPSFYFFPRLPVGEEGFFFFFSSTPHLFLDSESQPPRSGGPSRWRRAWGVEALTPPRLFLQKPPSLSGALGDFSKRAGAGRGSGAGHWSARLRREGTPTGVSSEHDAVFRGQQQDAERAVPTRSPPKATSSSLSEVGDREWCQRGSGQRGPPLREVFRVKRIFKSELSKTKTFKTSVFGRRKHASLGFRSPAGSVVLGTLVIYEVWQRVKSNCRADWGWRTVQAAVDQGKGGKSLIFGNPIDKEYGRWG